MKTTRLAARRAKPISWVTTIIVMPSRASAIMTSSTSLIISGSRRRGRLVEQHHLRVHGQRAGDRDALLLAAGQLRRVLVGLVGDARPGRAARRPRSSASALDLPRTLIGPSVTFSSIVLWAKRLNDWKTMPTSAAQPGQRLALVGQRLAVEADRARVDRLQPVDRPAQRRLAGAGRADDHDDLAAVDLQVDVLQHVQVAEPLVDARQHDERFVRQATVLSASVIGQVLASRH